MQVLGIITVILRGKHLRGGAVNPIPFP